MVQVIEYKTTVTDKNIIEIPKEYQKYLTGNNKSVRIMILIDDIVDEDALWSKVSTEQFIQGYSESDSIYDKL